MISDFNLQVLARETLFSGVHAHTVVFNVVARHLRPPTQALVDRLCAAEPTMALAVKRLVALISQAWTPEPVNRPTANAFHEEVVDIGRATQLAPNVSRL